MGYDNWCYRCRNITQAVDGDDLNKCNGCKQNANDHLPPSKFKAGNMYGGLNKKEEKEYDSNNHWEPDKKEINGRN